MDIARRQARINQLVREMLVEGLLNGQFQLIQTIRAAGDCQIVAKMILVYCTLIGRNIRAIANYLTKPNVDYAGAAVHAGHLGIRSCSIGAQSILHACCLFVQACSYGSKERCVGALNKLYNEYSRLLPKFMEVLQNLLRMSSKDVYSASLPLASSLLQLEAEILYLRRQR